MRLIDRENDRRAAIRSGRAGPWDDVAAAAAAAEKTMSVMAFEVCQRGRDARWIVRLGNTVYGSYLDKEQAVLDAMEAARDALQSGQEAQVWLRDQEADAARIL
jgi:hypothetical protein